MEALRPPVEELAQVRRIAEHHLFRGAESLCRLLRFLVEHAVSARSGPVREFDIAAGVFKRRQDFDPQSDSIVRVQIGRLRARRTRYYFEAGTSDPILCEIPRGGYSLSVSYRERPHSRKEAPAVPPAMPVIPASALPKSRPKITAVAWISIYSRPQYFRERHCSPETADTGSTGRILGTFGFRSAPPFLIYSNQVRLVPLPDGTPRDPRIGRGHRIQELGTLWAR